MFRILQHGPLRWENFWIANSLCQTCLQGMMVVIKTNIKSKMMKTTTLIPCRPVSKGKLAIIPRGVGGSHIRRSGVLFGNFTEKDPLRSTKILFSGRGSNIFSPRRATNSITNIICRYFLCWLGHLKDTVVASAVDQLKLNTLRKTKNARNSWNSFHSAIWSITKDTDTNWDRLEQICVRHCLLAYPTAISFNLFQVCPFIPDFDFKDVHAHCYCASLVRTLFISHARATSSISSARTKSKLNKI